MYRYHYAVKYRLQYKGSSRYSEGYSSLILRYKPTTTKRLDEIRDYLFKLELERELAKQCGGHIKQMGYKEGRDEFIVFIDTLELLRSNIIKNRPRGGRL